MRTNRGPRAHCHREVLYKINDHSFPHVALRPQEGCTFGVIILPWEICALLHKQMQFLTRITSSLLQIKRSPPTHHLYYRSSAQFCHNVYPLILTKIGHLLAGGSGNYAFGGRGWKSKHNLLARVGLKSWTLESLPKLTELHFLEHGFYFYGIGKDLTPYLISFFFRTKLAYILLQRFFFLG